MRMSCTKSVAQGKGTRMGVRINQRTGNLIAPRSRKDMKKGQYIVSHGKDCGLVETPIMGVHRVRVPFIKKDGSTGFREAYRGTVDGVPHERDHFLKGMGLGMPALWVKYENREAA